MNRPRLPLAVSVSLAIGLLLPVASLSACTFDPPRATPSSGTPAAETPTPPSPIPVSSAPPTDYLPVHPSGDPVAIASNLNAPWSILRLPVSGTLISERDTALIRELLPDGSTRTVGSVADARPSGEGGLLGLTFLPNGAAPGGSGWVYAYLTASDDNRIERMPLLGNAGGYELGPTELVLAGIPKAANHNGGRIDFGPDGFLYATTGDAGEPAHAQDLNSLAGKILRMTATGGVPDDNPFGTLVYSLGHRNPQGLAWDSHRQLWASEFGQNTWDELNRITPGGNYGWPVVEGKADRKGYIDPFVQWPTDEASPSGIAIVGDTLFMASLRGERLWSVLLSTGQTTDWFVHSFGRLRDVTPGPSGTLWFVSSNTDGRGDPHSGDDRLYQVQVIP